MDDDDDVVELDELLEELLLLDELDGDSLPPQADSAATTRAVPASRKQPAGNKAAEIFMIPPDLMIFYEVTAAMEPPSKRSHIENDGPVGKHGSVFVTARGHHPVGGRTTTAAETPTKATTENAIPGKRRILNPTDVFRMINMDVIVEGVFKGELCGQQRVVVFDEPQVNMVGASRVPSGEARFKVGNTFRIGDLRSAVPACRHRALIVVGAERPVPVGRTHLSFTVVGGIKTFTVGVPDIHNHPGQRLALTIDCLNGKNNRHAFFAIRNIFAKMVEGKKAWPQQQIARGRAGCAASGRKWISGRERCPHGSRTTGRPPLYRGATAA